MYRTEITGKQIIDALDANQSVFARLIDDEDGYVILCPLSAYQYVNDDQPCLFSFINDHSYIAITLVADDCNTPLEDYSPEPGPK